jgi:hypothetical protein
MGVECGVFPLLQEGLSPSSPWLFGDLLALSPVWLEHAQNMCQLGDNGEGN